MITGRRRNWQWKLIRRRLLQARRIDPLFVIQWDIHWLFSKGSHIYKKESIEYFYYSQEYSLNALCSWSKIFLFDGNKLNPGRLMGLTITIGLVYNILNGNTCS